MLACQTLPPRHALCLHGPPPPPSRPPPPPAARAHGRRPNRTVPGNLHAQLGTRGQERARGRPAAAPRRWAPAFLFAAAAPVAPRSRVRVRRRR
ncbi:TPA_asm: TRL1A sORF [Human alphaherpesvirus 1]|uniref:Uncharacterized protein n=1 Tax=Human herpesvirus 1 TaxID=10298 RepID=A0A2U9A5T6_HHV1|nr:hypothetical protein [Human alphaherpesvirus 1]DAC85434.1 TPA_asm: IRL1A sORF [Human alphaherpesvirus 1]DAC85469.1 TPA_asm: TRL1A sORF [Human alphaherpesvirus 1]